MGKIKTIEKFDMQKKPVRQTWYLRLLAWAISYSTLIFKKYKINKVNMNGLKPPYILLCTHMSFLDFMVTTAAIFPHRANYIVAIDGFIDREWLCRNAGCICKRKFTNDIILMKHIGEILHKNNDIIAIYPEARYSLDGTTSVLPNSLGKLVKLYKVPVVVLNMNGHYLQSPFWNLEKRKNRIEATMTQIITAQESKTLSVDSINAQINTAFEYDEYKWQLDNKISIKYKDNAKGLHKVLYKCPSCKTEYKMNSGGLEIWCEECGKHWIMSEYGQLSAKEGETEFSHIPDWYAYERAEVRKEIEAGTYSFEADVMVDSLPNAKGYVRLGLAKLTHNLDGFILESEFDNKKLCLKKSPQSMYSCHIEYEYFGKGDCVDLSTLTDTYYLYPQGKDFAVTKISLATEELFDYYGCKS